MCVDINEHKFEGCGKTKKEARMAAADKAFQFLLLHPEFVQKSNHQSSSVHSSSSPNSSSSSTQANPVMTTTDSDKQTKSDQEFEEDEYEQELNDDEDEDGHERNSTTPDAKHSTNDENESDELSDSRSKRLKTESENLESNLPAANDESHDTVVDKDLVKSDTDNKGPDDKSSPVL
jgi:hypothetical protein